QLLVRRVADLSRLTLGLELVERPERERQLILHRGEPVEVVGVLPAWHQAPLLRIGLDRRRTSATSATSSSVSSRSGCRDQRRRLRTRTTRAAPSPPTGSTTAGMPAPPLGVSRIQRPYRAT